MYILRRFIFVLFVFLLYRTFNPLLCSFLGGPWSQKCSFRPLPVHAFLAFFLSRNTALMVVFVLALSLQLADCHRNVLAHALELSAMEDEKTKTINVYFCFYRHSNRRISVNRDVGVT